MTTRHTVKTLVVFWDGAQTEVEVDADDFYYQVTQKVTASHTQRIFPFADKPTLTRLRERHSQIVAELSQGEAWIVHEEDEPLPVRHGELRRFYYKMPPHLFPHPEKRRLYEQVESLLAGEESEAWEMDAAVPAICKVCGEHVGDLEPDAKGVQWRCPCCSASGDNIVSVCILKETI